MLATEIVTFPESKFIFDDITKPFILPYDGRKLTLEGYGEVNFSGKIVVARGSIRTFKDGVYHSYNDEPAIIFPRPLRVWYDNGIKHRVYGPAEIGYTYMWFLNGKRLGFHEYMKKVTEYISEEEKLLILMNYGK